MALIDNDTTTEDLDSSKWSVDFGETRPLLPTTDLKVQNEKTLKLKLWKNVGTIVIALGIFTMGLNPIDDLQSSLNAKDGLGVTSLSIKYAMMIMGNLLTNVYLIRKLGSKWALICGSLLYSVYIAANYYPTWATLVPLTVAAGLGGALMWTTFSNYLAKLASHYALISGANEDRVQALFFGLRGTAGYASAALGGLVSSLILGTGVSPKSPGDVSLDRYAVCGPNYCNENLKLQGFPNLTLTSEPGLDALAVYGLCTFCLVATLIAVLLLAVFVDPLSSIGIIEQKEVGGSSCRLLLTTVQLWRNPKLLLLIPISFVYGFQEAFWRVEFSKAYITCALGIEYIGFLMVCYNIAALASSFICGWLGKRTLRYVAFPVMATIDIAALISMLYWNPTPEDIILAMVVTGVTGITYGGLSTLLLALFGIAFPENLEAAYSNLYFWSFLGSTLMYAWSFNLCLKVKLLVVLVFVVLGIFGYGLTEVLLVAEGKQKSRKGLENTAKRMLVPAGF